MKHYFKNRNTKQNTHINPQSFDDKETWSLDVTIAKFTAPRLERFIEIHNDMFDVSEEEKVKYEKALWSLKYVASGDREWILTDKQEKKLQEGLDIFGEIFMWLWW